MSDLKHLTLEQLLKAQGECEGKIKYHGSCKSGQEERLKWIKKYIEDKKVPWRAAYGGTYWYVSDDGLTYSTKDLAEHIDNFRFETGNYFRTEEEAQKEAKLREFERRVVKRFKELGGGVFRYGEENWSVFIGKDEVMTCCSAHYNHQRGWVAQDESIVKQIIGEFDFMGYARGEL